MKNKFIALALVTLSLATTVVSCTKDDMNPTSAQNAVKTASATLSVKVDEPTNATGKNVNRGTLPVSIDNIDVTVASTMFDWTRTTNFSLVGSGGEAAFNLDNVAAGNNNVSVITTTVAQPSLNSGVSNSSAENLMTELRNRKPFAQYTGGASNVNIVIGQQNAIPQITLTSPKGRNIAVFKLSEELETIGVTARITAQPNGGGSGSENGISFDVVSVNNNAGYIYWNNENASGGSSLPFTVTLMDKNGVALPESMQIDQSGDKKLKLQNVPMTSTNVIYTIKKESVIPVVTTQTFSAQWTDGAPTNGTIGE